MYASNTQSSSSKDRMISVYTTETTYHNAKDIDKNLVSKIDSIYSLQDELEVALENVNRYDTSIYGEIDSLRKVFLNNEIELKALTDIWNKKYEYKWSEPEVQSIDEPIEEGIPKKRREYTVYKIIKKRVKYNDIVNGGDSSVIIFTNSDSLVQYEIKDVKKRTLITSSDIIPSHKSFSLPTKIIIDTLYSIYYENHDNSYSEKDIEIEIILKSNGKIIENFRYKHKLSFTPTSYDYKQHSSIDQDVHTVSDSVLFLKDIDSIESVIRSNMQKNNFALFKIILDKSYSRTPYVIDNATRVRDSIKELIDYFDLKTDTSLDKLKSLLKSMDSADSVLDSELMAYGSGFPEEIYHQRHLLKATDNWNFESDKLLSFEIFGKGSNLQFEILEEGKSKPFISYSINDLNGLSSLESEEIHSHIYEYLYNPGSSFLEQYSTTLIFQVKSRGKILSRLKCTLTPTIG
jgi:hypothetical protein